MPSLASGKRVAAALVAAFACACSGSPKPDHAPSAGTSSLAIAPGTAVADGTSIAALTVTLKDRDGRAVAGAQVALSATGSANDLAPASGTTDANGVLVAQLRSTRAETKRVEAATAGLTLSSSVSFIPGAAAVAALGGPAGSVIADGVATATLTFTLADANGNPVPDEQVSIGATGAGNTLAPRSGATDAAGAFTATFTSTRAEAKTVTAGAAGLDASTVVTFAAGPASDVRSSLAASPDQLLADGVAVTTVTLALLDAAGNPLRGEVVSLAASGTGNTLAPQAGVTDAAGALTATLSSTRAESKTVTATAGGLTLHAGVRFTAGAPGSAALVVTPGSVVADGVATAGLTFSLTDANGNGVAGQTVDLTLSGSANALSPASGVTDSAGTFTATLASTKAEVKTVSATSAGFDASRPVTFVAGPPVAGHSSLTLGVTELSTDSGSATSVTVVLRDAWDNPCPGRDVELSASGGGTRLSAVAASGGTYATQLEASAAGAKSVVADVDPGTAGSFRLTQPVAFLPGAPSALTSTVDPVAATAVADGVTVSSLDVTVRDAWGNAVPGVTVTPAASPSTGVTVSSSGPTGSDGRSTVSLRSTVAGTKVVTATAGATDLRAAAQVAFTPGAPVASASTFTVVPAAIASNRLVRALLKVRARDANANPVPGLALSLASSPAGPGFQPSSAVATGADGVAAATADAGAFATYTLSASGAGGFVKSAALSASAAIADTQNTALSSGAPEPVTAGAGTVLTVTLKSAANAAIAAHTVTFTADEPSCGLSPASAITDSSGRASTTLTCTLAGVRTVWVSDGGVAVKAVAVTFGAAAPASGATTFSVWPRAQVADGSATATATATVRDASGNPVPGATVALTSSDPGADAISCPAGATGCAPATPPATGVVVTTDASGVAEAVVRSSTAGQRTLGAAVNGFGMAALASWVPGPPAQLAFVSAPTAVTSGVTLQPGVQLAVRDAAGNVVPTATGTVSLALTGAGALAGTVTVDVCRGFASFESVRVVGFTGANALAATAAGLAPATSATFTVSP